MTDQRLQGVGIVPTIKNSKLKIGDALVYNFGETGKIISLEKKTPKGKIFKVKYKSGKVYSVRKMNNGYSTIVNLKTRKFIKR